MKKSSFVSKIIAATLVISAVLSFSSCANTAWVFKSGKQTVPAGVYLGYLIDAYYSASNSADKDTDLFKQKVEKLSAEAYIKKETKASCAKYIAVDRLFDEYKLSFSSDELTEQQSYLDSVWSSVSKVYSENGCGKESLGKIFASESKYNKIFEYYYGENGKEPISEKARKEFFSANFAKIKYVQVNYSSHFENVTSSSAASEEQKTKLKEIAEKYASRINSGEAIDKISTEEKAFSSDQAEEATELEYSFVTKDTSDDADDLNKTIFAAEYGKAVVSENSTNGYIVFVRYKTDASTKDYSERISSVLSAMKSDDFKSVVSKVADEIKLTVNNSAVRRFKPQNVDLDAE